MIMITGNKMQKTHKDTWHMKIQDWEAMSYRDE